MACSLPTLIDNIKTAYTDKCAECACSPCTDLPTNQDNMCGDGTGLVKEIREGALTLQDRCTASSVDYTDPGEPSGCLTSEYLTALKQWIENMTCCVNPPVVCDDPTGNNQYILWDNLSITDACAPLASSPLLFNFGFAVAHTDDVKLQVKYDDNPVWYDVTDPVVERPVTNFPNCFVAGTSFLFWNVDPPVGGWNTDCDGNLLQFRAILTNDICIDTEVAWYFINTIRVTVENPVPTTGLTVDVDTFCYQIGDTIQIDWTAGNIYRYLDISLWCYVGDGEYMIVENLDIKCNYGSGTYYWQIPEGVTPLPPGDCVNQSETYNYKIKIESPLPIGSKCPNIIAPFEAFSLPFSIAEPYVDECLPVPWCPYGTSGAGGVTVIEFGHAYVTASGLNPCTTVERMPQS
jgi:hypothetical protein